MKKSIAASLLLITSISIASAAVTLQFTNPFVDGIAKNLGNSSGVATDGMTWGIIIDTTGDGFLDGAYTSFDITSNGFLSTSSGATDDYFVAGPTGGVSTYDSGPSGTGYIDANLQPGGAGTAGEISEVPFGTNGINFGDVVALVWFSTNSANTGDYYGFLNSGTFTIPNDGQTADISSYFLGNNTTVLAANNQIVPEPATFALMAGMLTLGLVAYRRRRQS